MYRLIVSWLLATFLLPSVLWAAITLDGTPTSGFSIAATTVTVSHTCTAGSVILAGVGPHSQGAATITSVTYNGVTLTALGTLQDGSGVEGKTALYEAVTGCDGAAHNMVATISSQAGGYLGLVIGSFAGVENASVAASHRTVYQGGAGGGGVNVTVVDSQSGDWVINVASNWSNAITAGGTSIIQLAESGGYNMAMQRTAASGASTVMSWTNDDFVSSIATALIPASAGGPDVTHVYKRRTQ